MTELSIPVRMIVAFLNLSIALQAVVLFVKKLGNFNITDRMIASGEFGGQSARALADPSQRRFGIASRARFNQAIQCWEYSSIR